MITLSMRLTRRILLVAVALGLLVNPLFHLHPLNTDRSLLQGDICKFCVAGGNLVFVPDPPAFVPPLGSTAADAVIAVATTSVSALPSSSRAPPLS